MTFRLCTAALSVLLDYEVCKWSSIYFTQSQTHHHYGTVCYGRLPNPRRLWIFTTEKRRSSSIQLANINYCSDFETRCCSSLQHHLSHVKLWFSNRDIGICTKPHFICMFWSDTHTKKKCSLSLAINCIIVQSCEDSEKQSKHLSCRATIHPLTLWETQAQLFFFYPRTEWKGVWPEGGECLLMCESS